MSKIQNMTQGKPLKLLFAFALPLMFGNIFQQLYTVVDTIIVGRGVGMDALAALGSVDWFTWLVIGIAQGYAQGFSVRIAQKFGEEDYQGLKHTIGQSAFLAIGIALLCTLASQLGIPLFMTLLKVPGDLRPMAELYSRILLGGFPAVVFYNVCSSILRAVGDSKTPLKAMIIASITNIVLDCVAVFWLDWGIAGAAAATVISQCLSGLICANKIRHTPELLFSRKDVKPNRLLSADLIRIGTPVAAKNIIIALGGMVIQSVVNGFGVSFIAGFTATNKLYGLLEIAAISYGYAVTTYVGQNFGAKRFDRIKDGIRSAVILALATSLVIAVIMFVFGRPITMLFISSDVPALAAEAGHIAYLYLCFMSASLPILYVLYVHQAALEGLGNTMMPMIAGIIELALRISITALVAFIGYEYGIFAAEVSAWYGSGIFLTICYYRTIKKLRNNP